MAQDQQMIAPGPVQFTGPNSPGKRTPLDPTASLDPATAQFGPGVPLAPQPGNPVRVWDFPVAVNTVITPRAYETSPALLRAYANIEPIRLAIETRKDQMESLQWSIKPKGQKTASGKPVKADPAKVDAMTAFWSRPDGEHDFATWLRIALEDLLVLDAPAFERRRTLGLDGGVGGAGKLVSLDVVPGDTIHPMVDATGRRPRGRLDVAYQQVIKGRPWINLTNADLLYMPRNPRPGHNYGMGPVEQVMVTINTVMRRQATQLAYFTEGNTPAGFITGPDGWTAEQLSTFQGMLDDRLSGSAADRSKLLVMPNGAKWQAFKDAPLKDDFDEWLWRITCYAFSLPPTPFIKAMNRSTAETDKERATSEGLFPLRLWFKRLADRVMADDFGITDHEWSWDDDIEIDPLQQATIDDFNVRNGTATLDEVRENRGDAAYPNGVGSKPMIIMTSGAVLVEQAIEPPVEPPAPVHVVANADGSVTPVPVPGQPPPPGKPGKPGSVPPGKPAQQPPKKAAAGKAGNAKGAAAASGHGGKPTAPKAEKLEKSAAKRDDDIDVNRPVPRRATKGLAKTAQGVLEAVGDDVAIHVARTLRSLSKAGDADATVANATLAAQVAAAADLSGLDDLVSDAFDDLFDVFVDAATAGIAQVGAATSDGLLGQIHDRGVAWAKDRVAELVATGSPKGIMDPTRDAVRRVIVDGLNAQMTTPQIAEAIQADRAFSPERAQLIAETEIKNANSNGVLEAYRQAQALGIGLQKYWQTNGGDNCCDDCQGNEDQGPIDIDEPFQSGDDCPAAHPNCNCTMNSVFTDANGAETDTGEE